MAGPDPLPAGWESAYLTASGFPDTPYNRNFLDYWHRLEGCGSPGHGNLNATCQGGYGGFLSSVQPAAPYYNDYWPYGQRGGLAIAGFSSLANAGADWGEEVWKNTPDLAPFLQGGVGDPQGAAAEMQKRGTTGASASEIQAIFAGQPVGGGSGTQGHPPAGQHPTSCDPGMTPDQCAKAGGTWVPAQGSGGGLNAGLCDCSAVGGQGAAGNLNIGGDIGSILSSILGGVGDIGAIFKEAALRFALLVGGAVLFYIGVRGFIAA